MNLSDLFPRSRARAAMMLLALVLLMHLPAGLTMAGETPAPLSKEEWAAFQEPFVNRDDKIQFSPSQRFLEDPNTDVIGKLIDFMASKDSVEAESMFKLFLVYFQRANKRFAGLDLYYGDYVADARLRALANGFCHEQSRFPTRHRAAMGIAERRLFAISYAVCLGACIGTGDFIQQLPDTVRIDDESFRDPKNWQIKEGEDWLRVHDQVAAQKSIFDRESCSVRIFCHPSAQSGNPVVAIGLQVLVPKGKENQRAN